MTDDRLSEGDISTEEALAAAVRFAIIANIATREHLDKLFIWVQ
jgi:hypothetical protein